MSGKNSLQIFDFEQKQVRIVNINGEPCFVAKDVVEGIGAIWNGESAIQHVPEEWKLLRSNLTSFGEKEMWCLTEQGLYFYLARSNKPAALPFQKKVAGEIMPSIRKYGAYMTTEALYHYITEPDQLMQIMQNWKADRDKRIALEAEANINAPLVLFAESVQTSKASILVGVLSKILKQNGIDIGQNRLFTWLRDNGYLIKQKGDNWNMPTQRAMEANLFEVKESTRNNPDGSIRVNKTTKVTGKGQIYFVNLFLNKGKDNMNESREKAS